MLILILNSDFSLGFLNCCNPIVLLVSASAQLALIIPLSNHWAKLPLNVIASRMKAFAHKSAMLSTFECALIEMKSSYPIAKTFQQGLFQGNEAAYYIILWLSENDAKLLVPYISSLQMLVWNPIPKICVEQVCLIVRRFFCRADVTSAKLRSGNHDNCYLLTCHS